jgi:hypothetical protein
VRNDQVPAATNPHGSRSAKVTPQVEISLRYRDEEELAAYRRLSQISSTASGSGKGKGKEVVRGQSPMRGRTLTPRRSGEIRTPELKSSRSGEFQWGLLAKFRSASREAMEMDRMQLELDRLAISGSRPPEGSRDGQRARRSAYSAARRVQDEEEDEEEEEEDEEESEDDYGAE